MFADDGIELKPAVLVVDDEDDNREILRSMLEDDGYPVLLARDGKEALRKARFGVGVILMDVHMPNLDGVSACKFLQANPGTRDIPVLFLSATEDDGVAMSALEAGAYDFLPKPAPLAELRLKIAAIANMPRVADPSRRRWVYLEALKMEGERQRDEEEAMKLSWHESSWATETA
ncbi:MAG: response regulator [Planctomycetota bacterium]|nr:response regulator [Planctomycetota bacterium]